jgi:hypothetical protein
VTFMDVTEMRDRNYKTFRGAVATLICGVYDKPLTFVCVACTISHDLHDFPFLAYYFLTYVRHVSFPTKLTPRNRRYVNAEP